MPSKKYKIWLSHCYTVDIVADKSYLVSIDDKPIKIRFMNNDNELLAEFYCDKISGFAEVDYIADWNGCP